jgi:hypothetical protein
MFLLDLVRTWKDMTDMNMKEWLVGCMHTYASQNASKCHESATTKARIRGFAGRDTWLQFDFSS